MPAFSTNQQVLSPYHAMGCNPVSMVDPLGLAFTLPSTWGTGSPTALDIALWQVPTKQLDKVYGGDPWSMKNRGALNDYEADMAGKQIVIEAVTGLLSVRRYNYYVGLEKQRDQSVLAKVGEDASGHNFRTDDITFDGNNRISILSGNLNMYISTRNDGRIGIIAFAVYSGDLSKYTKTEWIQIAKTNRPLDEKPYEEWFNDYAKDDKEKGRVTNNPFYFDKGSQTRAWRKDMASIHGGSIFFDSPNRGAGNYYWQAQLSLVGFRNGSWETIHTVRYGFVADGTTINYMSPFFLNIPDKARDNLYNRTINSINNFRR